MSDHITHSSTRGGLPILSDSTPFVEWRPRAIAALTRHKVAYVLAGDRPTQPLVQVTVQDPANVGQYIQRQESVIELQLRKEKYDADLATAHALIIEACVGEAASIVRGASNGNGKEAMDLLDARYNVVGTTRAIALIISLAKTEMTAQSVRQHVTNYQEQLRLLLGQGVTLDDEIKIAFFLMSLPSRFNNFVDNQLLMDDLRPEGVYAKAIEYEAQLAMRGLSGEADNRDSAMYGQGRAAEGRRRGKGRRGRGPCFHCKGDHFIMDCPDLTRDEAVAKIKAHKERVGDKRGRPDDDEKANEVKRLKTEMEAMSKQLQKLKKGRKDAKRQQQAKMAKVKAACAAEGVAIPELGIVSMAIERQLEERIQDHDSRLATALSAVYGDSKSELPLAEELVAAIREELDGGFDGATDADTRDNFRCRLQLIADEHLRRLRHEQAMALEDTHVKFRFDTGASWTFVSSEVPIENERPSTMLVEQADGTDIAVDTQGDFACGVGKGALAVACGKSAEFAHSLFSGLQAVKAGCKVVLEDGASYIHHLPTGTRYPLVQTEAGWDLTLPIRNQLKEAAFVGQGQSSL